MVLVEALAKKNPCYKAGKKITVKGLMLHSVGCSQPHALVFVNRWNSESYDRACVHGFIDAIDGTVYQMLPWNHRGWHAGGTANNTHIGVEMCEPDCITYVGTGNKFTVDNMEKAREMTTRTYRVAVELYAMLCKQFSLDPMKDIISHKEGHEKGIASNHGDPEHLWKGLGMSYTMDTFRRDVKTAMDGGAIPDPEPTPEPKKNNEPEKMKVPFNAVVTINDLNIRKEPRMGNNVLGMTGKGTFVITKVDGNWGLMDKGWIYLTNPDYCYLEEIKDSVPFYFVVVINDLNIRKEPKMGNNICGQTGKGTFTIVETKNGWGRLKSGAGWIWLKNPEYGYSKPIPVR